MIQEKLTEDQERFQTESESVAEVQNQTLIIAEQKHKDLQEMLKEMEGALDQERKTKSLMESSFREQYVSAYCYLCRLFVI